MATNYNNAESLSDIVTSMENNNEWWENALDQYQNYTYHLELFVVKQRDALEFLLNEAQDLDSIISNSWPGSDIQYITIAETGVTTEFNIQDLEIKSLGAGSSSVSRLAGTATRLSFSIIQVGNTSLNDNLMNAALLSGYASISEAKYFLKVNFKGYSDDGSTIRSKNQNLTKVFPFVISNVGDVPSSTDARGTITTIEGTITPDYAVSRSVNLIQHNFEFDIKETLKETIEEFFTKLNENIQKNDFSTESAANNQYIHTYDFEFDNDFMTEFGESMMNGDEPNVGGSARNEVATRTGSVNISQQTGVITPGLSIVDVLYDICIQSIDIRTELTTEKDTFTKVVTILPDAAPKPNGLNPLSGEAGHNVKYFITTKNQIVVQNNYDNANKVTNSAKLVKEIFDRQQCKKIYYYQYTGLNDQVLDLNISLNRQLIKAYNLPKDDAFAQRFIEGNEQIIQDLNPRAKAKLAELQSQLSTLEGDKTAANENLDSIRSQVENASESVTQAIVNNQRDALLAQGVDPQFARQSAESLRDQPLQAQLQAAQQYDPDILSNINEERERYNELLERYNSAQTGVSTVDTATRDIERRIDEVTMQALGANFSAFANTQVNDIANNFSGIAGQVSDSNQIIMEELDDDLISTLTTQQLEDIVEALLINPVIFKRGILPYLTEKSNTRIYSSSNEQEVDLAKEKFYEAVNMDISMEQLKLTIKGDPYWIDTYLTPKVAKELFGNSNAIDTYRSHPTSINGANYVTIVTNKAAGVDENDNTKIANLATMLYAVKNVTSSFSDGQFVQQLDMIRIPVPDSFLPVNPFFSTIIGDGFGYGNDPEGEFAGFGDNAAGIGSGERGDPRDFGDPFGRGGGTGGNGNSAAPVTAPGLFYTQQDTVGGGLTDPSRLANEEYKGFRGSLITKADKILDDGIGTAKDSAAYAAMLSEAEMLAANGSTQAQADVDALKQQFTDFYGTPEEAATIINEEIENGTVVSPEFLGLLDKVYGEPLDVNVDRTAVTDEIVQMDAVNYMSMDEIISNYQLENPATTVETMSSNPIATARAESIRTGELKVSPRVDPKVVAAHKQYALSRIEGEKTVNALVTGKEAVILAKIGNEQVRLLDENYGSWSMMSEADQNYYDKLVDKQTEIEDLAKNDPSRFLLAEQKLIEDLDVTIEEYQELDAVPYDWTETDQQKRLSEMQELENIVTEEDFSTSDAIDTKSTIAVNPDTNEEEVVTYGTVVKSPIPIDLQNVAKASSDIVLTQEQIDQYTNAQSDMDSVRRAWNDTNDLVEVKILEYDGSVSTEKFIGLSNGIELISGETLTFPPLDPNRVYSFADPEIRVRTAGGFDIIRNSIVSTNYDLLEVGRPIDEYGDGILEVEIGAARIQVKEELE